ncbi:hypothetical protein BJF90_00375 [Pseudonocardia sp. CNS-004]|nr:hypothetical protein BJF90_00375 [Pseudonocardia sp. CNS-004]
MGKVARLYYEHGLTHAEIAELQGLSRVKVTRLLADARRLGIVEIRVHSDDPPFAELEAALVQRYDLQRAWVAPDFGSDLERSTNSLGLVGAACLTELVPPAQRVAVGLSTSVASSVAHLRDTPAADVEVVPVAGSRAGRSSVSNPGQLALGLAQRSTARPTPCPRRCWRPPRNPPRSCAATTACARCWSAPPRPTCSSSASAACTGPPRRCSSR